MSQQLDDDDLRDWIANDEGLYNWYISEGGDEEESNMQEFIDRNREELTKCVNNVLDGHKPAHYLRYGG